ncbi:DUF305 domain-containing protein [Teichococcus aerophilus]|uniref:DUF305 domain-containing protein n=1 Tax=Teichococcus aerophilus TaxID=1224513 RepID=UPI00188819B5|nr:DUF305 domain-containing protein [Pseudoroseomonas aerophila]
MQKLIAFLLLALTPTAAMAHVKWFAAYEVAAAPVPIGTTLSLLYFWVGLGLVLLFFVVTTLLERRSPGIVVMKGLDTASAPLQRNADHFLIAVLFAFFVALFAVGGTYLTPELKTEAGWVPWAQLLIALLLPARRTRPIAAAAIVLLWLVTLRDYDLFHLFDYLALGLGLAGYLLLSGLPDGTWHTRRFALLRWGIALALMWSSLEKFMYPQWFLPLLEERPYLAFGIPFGPYTTMAGVAEFTLGFGLLWTPLVRRLSALALFALMFAAVYPFGRVDMIGHATILASLLIVVAYPEREAVLEVAPRNRWATPLVPVALALALALSMGSYFALHRVIYAHGGTSLAILRAGTERMAQGGAAPGGFWRGQEHYHGHGHANAAPQASASAAMQDAMEEMHHSMGRVRVTGELDRDFIALMLPHHEGAVAMARLYMESGQDPQLRQLAAQIIAGQEAEIGLMEGWNGPRTAPH